MAQYAYMNLTMFKMRIELIYGVIAIKVDLIDGAHIGNFTLNESG